ncbi:U6 snRNA phosphodiesterase 1 [Plasmodiophora brassicae]
MSLSKTATLRRHEIRAFVDELGKAVRDLRSFRVRFRRLILLVNEERSRTFVGASAVERDVGAVAKLIERVDMAMRAFGLPVYYADPKPHVTLAWCIGDQRQELSHVIGDDPLSLDADAAVVVDSVSAKIGNRLYTVYLKDQ